MPEGAGLTRHQSCPGCLHLAISGADNAPPSWPSQRESNSPRQASEARLHVQRWDENWWPLRESNPRLRGVDAVSSHWSEGAVLVRRRGIEPRSRAHRARALPLDEQRKTRGSVLPFELQDVPQHGARRVLMPHHSHLESGGRVELPSRVLQTRALAARTNRSNCAPPGIRTQTVRVLGPVPLPVGLGERDGGRQWSRTTCPEGIRSTAGWPANPALTCASRIWWVQRGSNPHFAP